MTGEAAVCAGLCAKYRVKRKNGGHYRNGHKLCRKCGVFMAYEGARCPCCRSLFRRRPRNRRLKEALTVVSGESKPVFRGKELS